MDATTHTPDLRRTTVIALGMVIAGTLLTAVALTAVGLIDPVAMLTWPTTIGSGGSDVGTYWYESSSSDPLVTGIDLVLGAFPRTIPA